jgi:rare lipoprotein A (peptidoglycan hydrolase)
MRTHILSAVATLAVGMLALTPANAENAPWTCMSPAFACGGAPAAKSDRAQEWRGERTYRRQASGKRARQHVAKHESAKRKAVRTAKVKVVPLERREQAKVELPERKQTAAAATAETKAPAPEKKPEIAVRTVETERAYRVTSTQSGMASYYGSESGSQTASGQRFNPRAMTAAHRTLPFGTQVRVTNKRNGKSVVVTINDRGPFIRGRIIDLSTAAAGIIGMRSSGVAPVTVERIATN